MHHLFKQSVANPTMLTGARRQFLFNVLYAYGATVGALLSNEALLEEEWWERGELYRLLSPLAFTMEFIAHPLGGKQLIKSQVEKTKTAPDDAEHADVGLFGTFMLVLIDDVLKPVMVLNRILTSGRLGSRDNPDIRLLERSVLKQDMVASTIMLMYEEMGNGVADGNILVASRPWQAFIDVWQNFKGDGFESLVSKCGDAAIRLEGLSPFKLLYPTTQYLASLAKNVFNTTDGHESTSRATTESEFSKSRLERILDFLFLWTLILVTGLENAREKKIVYLEAAKSNNLDCLTDYQHYVEQRTYQQFVLQLRLFADSNGIKYAIDLCSAIWRSDEKVSLNEKVNGATCAAGLTTLLITAKTFCFDDEDLPLSPILDGTFEITENYIALVRATVDVVRAYPEDYLNHLPIDNLKLLSKLIKVSLDGPARAVENLDRKIGKDPELLGKGFQAVECLLAIHVTAPHIEGFPESLNFLREPVGAASTYINSLWKLVNDMSDLELSNRTKVPVEVYVRVMEAGGRAIQAACKVSLLGLTSPGCSELFALHNEMLSAEKLDSLGIANVLYWHIAMPQLAWQGYTVYCSPAAVHFKIPDFFVVRSALVLQLLQVMSHVTEGMEAHLKVLATSPLYKGSYFIDTWAGVCCNMLPKIAVGSEPGLNRVTSFVEAVAEIDASDGAPEAVRDLTSLVEDLEKVKAQDDLKDKILVNRAKALSYLQCTNLECTTLLCSLWETKKPMVCSGCKCVRYCSEKCQKIDWKAHKRACRLIAATS